MEDEISLKEYFSIIKRHWFIFFVGFTLVFSGVIAYTFLSEPVYEARSLIVITSQDQANFILGSSALRTNDIETQKVIIQSQDIVYPVYLEFGERDFDLIVNNIRNSNIIEIIVRTNDSELAAMITNKIANNYIYYTTSTRREDAIINAEFITEKIAVYDEEISALDELLTSYDNRSMLTREETLEYQSIEREMIAKTKLYDFLLTKREEAMLTSQLNTVNLKIIEYAEVPDYPIRPNKPLNIIIGFVLALGSGLGLSVLADNLSPKKPNSKRLTKVSQ